ncbi:LacI family DNA-binding transcriptional regulator [Pedobacter sp.]|jgi:LacI family transcriptional regulator|uniref:LacI family DNA-binding transcriptional regulator n=1 Tax=Pedobacter sp. TaxID=1411316 RepID=UPI002C646B6D|nr:LacI family DNA-binding transcriptional regulator [Pedobacter sp.]HWW40388.1 LacI family DNA-binding transcriptional regulator [Pedobacter sp.]
MTTKALSIKDIAKKANVSITTVSFILNGKAVEKNISTAVIERVEKIIKDDGFKPNQVARSLRTGSSKIIGLIVEDISNPFFSAIARLIEDKAYKKDYKIIYSSTENHPGKMKELINLFKSRQVDAYIISPALGTEQDIQALLDEHKPVVLFDRFLPSLDVSYVGIDHIEASYKATEHFLKLKKKNIALVTIDLEVEQIVNRYDGYKQAILDYKGNQNESLVLKVPFGQEKEETIAQLKELFKEHAEIDAVLFATNYLAISGLTALKEMEKVVDTDFSVIAYDDGDVFKLHTPQISALGQPLEEIAERIISLILMQLSSKEVLKTERVILSGELIVR